MFQTQMCTILQDVDTKSYQMVTEFSSDIYCAQRNPPPSETMDLSVNCWHFTVR